MNLVYFNFLFIQTIKRRPVWITWILFLFAIACFLIILPAASGIETLQLWANTSISFAQTIMGMITGIFTAILAINIFRDTQEEGTELIVISKPITRNKIVLTKFLVFGFVCLLVNITAVILTSFTILLPETEKSYFVGLVVSMFIGNAISFAILGAISILTSVKWAKIGVIVTNLLITLILLIFQILAAFVFKTPRQALESKDASFSSHIYAQRNMETGEYTEKNLVDFDIPNTAIKNRQGKAITWEDVEQFWKNDIKGIDPSKILNVADLASQVALTYSTYDLHRFSKRQARRMFSASRYYDYDLVKPISPEIIGNDSNVCWLWSWPRSIKNPADSSQIICYLPGGMYLPLIQSFDFNSLKGLTNKLPIGQLRSNEDLFWENIYFEPDEWKKYKKGFDQIYKYVFDYTIKTKEGEHYYNLGTEWWNWSEIIFLDTNNFNSYYELLWHFFKGDADQIIQMTEPLEKDYNIKSVYDMNTRYTQFKYYLMFKLWEEEKNILNTLPENGTLINRIQSAYDTLKTNKIKILDQEFTYEQLLGVKIVEFNPNDFKGFYIECARDEETGEYIQDGVLTPGIRVPCFDWLSNTGLQSEDPESDIIQTSPWMRYKWVCRITDALLVFRDVYMFDSLEQPTRSDKFYSQLNYTWDTWDPSPDCFILQWMEIPSQVASSSSFFEYTMTSRTKNWIFVAIWGTIAMMGYAGGSIVYKKYDVK